MAEITTAAELADYPLGTAARLRVVRGSTTEFPLAQRVRGGWQTGVHHYPDEQVACVLEIYRPDRPVQPTVLPTVEALALHLQEYWARSARRREPIIWADLARDTLALIGEPTVQPDLATLALVVHQGWQGYECTCGLDDLGPVERETVTRVAGAVLDAIRGEQP